METDLYATFLALDIDKKLLALTPSEITDEYFCYPKNAMPIGFEGAIMYCFIKGCVDTVFACNPESCADKFVYPLAENFKDFIAIIIACGSANPVEQIIWMNREQFENHLELELENLTAGQRRALGILSESLGITAMKDPFGYVKELQNKFDYGKILFNDSYYEALGIEH